VPRSSPFAARLTTWLSGPTRGALIARNVVIGLAYLSLAELAVLPRDAGGPIAMPAWPAHGLALVAVWMCGPRVQPGLIAAAAIFIALRVPAPLALIGAVGPSAGVYVAVRLLKRLRFDDRLERTRDPLALTLIAAPASAVVSATIGSLTGWLSGFIPGPGVPVDWLLWVMRNWLGIAMFVPLVFAWRSARPVKLTQPVLVEAGVLVTAMLFLAAFIVWMWAVTIRDLPVGFLAFPFVVWAGLRFGARGASAVVATVVGVAIFASVYRLGPSAQYPLVVGQVLLFLLLLMIATVGPVLAATKAERDDAVAKRVLLEEQLRHSQKMESMGRLAGGVAHDFNNLLTAIIGYTEIVLVGMDPRDPKRADAEQISRAAMRAAELTRQMLAFSRRESQQPKVMNVNLGLQRVEPMLRRVIGEDIKLTISPRAGRATVRVDGGQLEQVVTNLAVNARDAMPKGGRLTIETTDITLDEATAEAMDGLRPGEYVMLTVSDTGLGMSAVVRARVFEPYFTTKDAGKGTGLGLSTVYGIVRQAEGHIAVVSEVGVGTTVRVLLPYVAAEAVAETEVGAARLPGGSEHVLLLEDDPSVRRLAKDQLTRLGYSVIEAASGRAGMALGSDDTRHFDLVVCDVMLGDMSGPSVAEALQALRPEIRVLYISGYTDDVIMRTGVLEQGRPFLQKPFTPMQLARKIREVLESRETDAA
jgi:signal transduction histidine kinase/ActR/RegA family two-component response regulator